MEIGAPHPGDLGWLIAMHGQWYAENTGFGIAFEAKVAEIAGNVAARLAPPRVSMFFARDEVGPFASLTADGDDPDECRRGHIRLVIADPRAQGSGVGRQLLAMGLANLRASGLTGAYLDTFQGLDTARALYLGAGFRLASEADGDTWGVKVREQRYVLDF
jgi:ribosomal protein S18 acetylase RimI-like enzyme